ncbi:MAG TPA: hypothetical protein DIW52_04170 [Pseudomonas sp.]|nr:hypothetical protein [Pseudomonas sp.]
MLPLGCAAVVNLLTRSIRHQGEWFWGCFAAQREQAPSPQVLRMAASLSPPSPLVQKNLN